MIHEKENALKILAKYLKRSDPGFLEEMYAIAHKFTERIPRVDPRTVSTVLEFEPVKGVDPEALASKVINNSLVGETRQGGIYRKGIRQSGSLTVSKDFGREWRS